MDKERQREPFWSIIASENKLRDPFHVKCGSFIGMQIEKYVSPNWKSIKCFGQIFLLSEEFHFNVWLRTIKFESQKLMNQLKFSVQWDWRIVDDKE